MEDLNAQDLAYEVSILLEATLFYAGVKKQNLDEAVEIYIENIDKILQNSQKEGFEEIVEVVEFMKKHHSHLFN